MKLQHILFIFYLVQAAKKELEYDYYDYFNYDEYADDTSMTTVTPELSKEELKKCDPKCVFQERPITSKNIGSFPKCATVCAQLLIDSTTKLTMNQLTTAFKSMRNLIGGIQIYDTNYTNANFLAGLQKLESATTGIEIIGNNKMVELGLKNLTSVIATYFNVYNNEKLLKLNLPKWKTFKCQGKDCYITVSIDNVWKENFCITTDEIKPLMSVGKTGDVHINGIICAPPKTNKKQCTKPTVGCEEMIGDLEIDAKFDTKKVKTLKVLYGSLIVEGSNLTDFNFLGNLTQIVQIDEFTSAIDVQNNKKLKSAAFPKLKLIWSTSSERVFFDNNNDALLKDYLSCYAFRSAFSPTSAGYEPNFSFKLCEEMETDAKKGATTKKATTKKATTKKSR